MKILAWAVTCALSTACLGQAIDIFGGQNHPPGQQPPGQQPPAAPPAGQPPAQPQPNQQPGQTAQPGQPVDPGRDWQADVQPSVIAQMAGDIRNLGAPDWCKPGVRLTYYNAAATVAQSGYQLIEDPKGDWEDPRTGKKYRKTDDDPKPGDTGGGSGDGVSQVDIVSVGRNAVAGNLTMYTINRSRNPPDLITTPGGGVIANAVSPSDTWIHPRALAAIQQTNADGFMILRGKRTIDNQPVDALCIVNQSGSAYASYTYDLRTGLLLSSSTATSAQPTSTVHLPGQPPPAGNMQLTYTKFVSLRQLKLPTGGPLPEAARKQLALRYTGQTNWVNPVDPSSANLTYPTEVAMTVDSTGPNWAMVKVDSVSTIAGVPQKSQATLMAGTFSGVWVHPRILSELKPNMVLDEDPTTKIKIYVTDVRPGAVTIATEGPGTASRNTYDTKSGLLTGLVTQTPSAGTTTEVRLRE